MDASLFTNTANQATDLAMSYGQMELVQLLGNSLAIGLTLFLFNFRSALSQLNKNKPNYKINRVKVMLGAANILYLCLGLTVVMILVNNNLARAFAIGATVALVRFRVKLEDRSAGSNILFGIIAGMACGLNEVFLGWVVAFLYILITTSLDLAVKFQTKNIDSNDESLNSESLSDELTLRNDLLVNLERKKKELNHNTKTIN